MKMGIVLTAMLLGCHSGPQIIASTPRQVTFDHADKDDVGGLIYCETYGRDAERASNVDDDRHQMTFRCVDRMPGTPAAMPPART